MKRTKHIIFLILIIFFPFSVHSTTTITLATDTTPGGNYIVGGGPTLNKDLPGIEIELYRMIAKELDFDLKIKRIPWKLCKQKLVTNQVDGIFPASFTQKRMKIGHYPMAGEQVDPSRKTRNNAYYLYTLKGTTLSWNGEKILGQSGDIGVPLGWAIVDDMRQRGVQIREIPVHENSPRLLTQGKLQGFICLETVFDHYLLKHPKEFANVVKASLPIWEKPYYLMFSKKFVSENPELSEKIWNMIKEIKSSDRFSKLTAKYMNR